LISYAKEHLQETSYAQAQNQETSNQIKLCWVFVLAALLLKQISMFVMLDTMFQHVLDDVLDDVSTCPFCSCVTFLHGCGLKKCICGISLPCLYGLSLF